MQVILAEPKLVVRKMFPFMCLYIARIALPSMLIYIRQQAFEGQSKRIEEELVIVYNSKSHVGALIFHPWGA